MKRKVKTSYFLPTMYLLILFVFTALIYFTRKSYDSNVEKNINDNITYVSSSIFSRTIPIINIQDTVKNPFIADGVTIGRYFYNSSDDEKQKANSIVFYDDTYMPNTGIDYVFKDIFDVVSIYDGTVIDVFDNELLGKTVQIRHNGEVISVYQSLGTIDVKKGDIVFTGQRIGTSGTNKINKELGNHLHLEIIKNGKTIDPISVINHKLGDI